MTSSTQHQPLAIDTCVHSRSGGFDRSAG
jgi:hypothetical protein